MRLPRLLGRRDDRPGHPTLKLNIMNGGVEAFVDWPAPAGLSPEEAHTNAQHIAATVMKFTNCEGPGFSMCQSAIGYTGKLRGEEAFSDEVLEMLNGVVGSRAVQAHMGQRQRPVVRASEIGIGGGDK
jgi:hypothetical protein